MLDPDRTDRKPEEPQPSEPDPEDAGETASGADEPFIPQVKPGNLGRAFRFRAGLTALLGVYLGLFVATGYLAFINTEQGPELPALSAIDGIQEATLREYFLDAYKSEEAEHSKRVGLATQSFNVVLGALLGFMSACATSLLKQS